MQLSSLFDYQKILASQENTVNLMVRFRAPELPADNKRPPLRLVAVLDHSGSMSGEKYAAVQATMNRLVDNLTAEDELAMVFFSSSNTPTKFFQMNSAGKAAAKQAIDMPRSMGGTALIPAMETTVGLIRDLKDKQGTVTRVFLLTDGQPDSEHGLVEGVGQFPHFIGLSCFGYGDSWNEQLLTDMATRGNGSCYYIADTKVINRVFATELGGMLTVYARDIKFDIRLPEGTDFDKLLNDYEPEVDEAQRCVVNVGDLHFEEDRNIILRLKTSPASGFSRDIARDVAVSATYTNLADGQESSATATGTLEWVLQSPDRKANQMVAEEVAVLEAASAAQEAKKLAAKGEWKKAQGLVSRHISVLQSVGGAYATSFANVMEDQVLGALTQDFDSSGAGAKGITATAAFAMRSKSGVVGAGASAQALYQATATDAVKKVVDDFEEDKDDKKKK